MNTLTFDAVPRVLTEIAQELADTLAPAGEILAIRDLWGRVRFIVRERPAPAAPLVSALDHLAAVAAKRLGPRAYAAEDAVLYADESFADIEPLWVEPGIAIGSPGIVFRLIDRQITGQSWATVSEQDAARASHRIAMYSLKGGVGRSTTTAMAAWHLARLGRSVLVLDLDLESPGLSASLLPTVSQPEFGIVDWFVEDAVGQSDAVIPHMSARAPMAQDLPGDVWVVPSHGADPGDFMAKLGRCYLDLSGSAGVEAWDRRLLRLLSVLEADKAPDVVLLDARSGFHDLASAVVTELADTVLLFAIHSEQTWSGYRLLFEHWQRYGVAGIKRGVQSASEVRVRELQEDYPWVNTLMEPLNGKVVPCTFAAVATAWQETEALRKLEHRVAEHNERLPPAHLGQGTDGVQQDLEKLGIFLRLRDGLVNIPDVFRVGYGLGRRGGVRPIRAGDSG